MPPLESAGRLAVAARFFRDLSSEEKSKDVMAAVKGLTDEQLDGMGRLIGVPDHQKAIYRAFVRAEKNAFMDEMAEVEALLKPGDVILITGSAKVSKALAAAQKMVYTKAKSSHVALIHADFVCVDAIPELGVTNRLISEVLAQAENSWRVIRSTKVQLSQHDLLSRACGYYLAQPYKIFQSGAQSSGFSYCSELARKVYLTSGIAETGIPTKSIIAPAHFDQLADTHSAWIDVTSEVKPAIEFCKKFEPFVKSITRPFIVGLELNRKRFQERQLRAEWLQSAANTGVLTKAEAKEKIAEIREIERSLNNQFWDVQRSD